ncbi:hypothetical protein HY630_03110 [Candidatus Uhrbacteria bacterium]|nr:hypothetical protein [Candidatus Uhrbacteria bacterium]
MKKTLAFLLVGVAVVLAITFASYIVLMQFRPEKEIRAMMVAMASLKSARQESGFSWSHQEDGERVSTTLYLSGPVLVEEDLGLSHATKFRVVHLSQEDSYQDLAGELRTIDGESYLTYEPPGPDIASVDFEEKTWVGFGVGELPLWGPILPGLDLPIDSILSKDLWTSEGRARLQYLLSYADIFHVEYNGLTEMIDGVNTRIIDGRFDPEAIEAFLLDLVRAKEGREPNDSERLVADRNAAQLSRLTLRFWIGLGDHSLYRFQAAGGFEDSEGTELLPVDVRIEFSKFNEPAEITAGYSVHFQELFETAFGTFPTGGTLASTNKRLVTDSVSLPVIETASSNDPDDDGLDNLLEAFYGTSRTVADTDGDGMNDGDEVRRARNPRGNGSLFGFGL